MTRHKGLGRGLDALLGGSGPRSAEQEELAQLPVSALRPGKYQPRTRMDEASLAELAASIRVRGVIQPIVVRTVGTSQYEILAGERRWRAARIAGLERVPAVVREVPDDAALGIGLIENIQREDLNPLEEANGLKRLIEEFKLTHEEVAGAIGRSRAGVTNLLRLLELAAPVQEMLQDGRIDMGHARALLALSKSRQVEVAGQVAARGLSVRETEALVRHEMSPSPMPPPPKRADPNTRAAEDKLKVALGTTHVRIIRKGKGGRIEIDFTGEDELQRMYETIVGERKYQS